MQDSPKYLIHAAIRTSGVVERSDVVGAIFGQTEGLLGDELDLRDLQESSKVGRIDVDIDSEGGRSFGSLTVASGLDKIETAVLAAALETIERVGPSRAEVTVTEIEDTRAAKRRELVDRATELLGRFENQALTSSQLVEEVRQRARVEDITEYEGLPAGSRVVDSDAIIVVEGRADVRQLLQYGIKNAVAVEGTDVPDAVVDLTNERTVTAFFDGDRGGDLILRELAQLGDIDYVAFAPTGKSVEDLSHDEVMSTLREKIPYADLADASAPDEALADHDQVDADGGIAAARESAGARTESATPASSTEDTDGERSDDGTGSDTTAATEDDSTDTDGAPPETLPGHVAAVEGTEQVRLLDDTFQTIAEAAAGDAFDAVADADTVPSTLVLDGTLTQRVLDVAAQRGVGQVVAAGTGSFVKQPTGVRIRSLADALERAN
jgi:DNA primase